MIELYEHNRIAYEAVERELARTGKAAVIHPTGTGKSFIALKLAEAHACERFVWVSPSEYIFRTQMENLRAAADFEPENIAFLTYAKLMTLPEEAVEVLEADYIVLDEFHRCGAPEWSKGVERLLHAQPDAKLLGLTATNIRYLDNQRDMADELFDGCVASEMSLSEAVVQGILPAPKYVVTMYSCQEELEKYARRARKAGGAARQAAEEYLQQLRRKLEQSEGLDEIFARHMREKRGKYLCFCANREHMKRMRAKVGEWFGKVDGEAKVYEVYSESPEAREKYEQFRRDDSDHLKLLFCIDMLNEGIHVDDVAGVILFRPTVSPIVYKQQIGRALSAAKRGAPVIFDVVNNFENLYSVAGFREEMEEIVRRYQSERHDERIIQREFEVIDEVRECRELFNKIEAALEATWEMMYEEARRYREKNGDLNVPVKYRTETNLALGQWVLNQRQIRRGTAPGSLTASQIAKLDRLGMQWEWSDDASWEAGYAHAKEYREACGDLKVPANYVAPDGYRLGAWIANMRTRRKSGDAGLEEVRAQRLDELGMIWDVYAARWELAYEEAKHYAVEHGKLEVPVAYERNGIRLKKWLDRQRDSRARGELSAEREHRLDELGMIWEKSDPWEESYREAAAYRASEGNLEVPSTYVTPSGVWLGKWLYLQREARRKGELPQEKIRRLDELGMRWDSSRDQRWQRRYDEAAAYLSIRNDTKPSDPSGEMDASLYRWLCAQRRRLKQGKCPEWERTKLNALTSAFEGSIWKRWGAGKHRICSGDIHEHLTPPKLK